MNRKQFLKRLGLLSTTAIASPVLLYSNPQPPKIQIKPSIPPDHSLRIDGGKGVERMRIGSNGDCYYYKIY
jgi:hypothetical protein